MRGWLVLLAVFVASAAGAVEFRQPVNGEALVSAYFDNGGTRDYTCGGHTYGGHRGTDIAIVGRFEAQDAGRDVVAAAPGRVVASHDGEFDRCTTGDCAGGGGFGNYVSIEHADGKVSYYAHLRRGSVRVGVGAQVACGDVIGQVGSSGRSTGPHLHFEVRVGGASDDPFAGDCGGPLSYWVEQGGYRGLPARRCEAVEPDPPPPPMRPDFHLAESLELPARGCDFEECGDAIRDGRSGGVLDAWVGETVRWAVVVHNRGAGRTAAESPEDAAITLGYAMPDAFEVVEYVIESDHPAHDRQQWARNDAMENAANPPADAAPAAGVLRLNGYSPGEAKRVVFTLRARDRSVDGPPAELRAWVAHVRDYYGEKTAWDDPVEVNAGQSFNGGDLRIGRRVDVFDATRWLFDGDDGGQLEGWRRCSPDAVGQMVVNTVEGALAVEVTGERPCVESPPIAVPLDGLAGVRLVVRQHQAPRLGVLAWSTVDEPSFDRARQVVFETAGGGVFEALHLGPGWGGTLTRLRLWPVLSNGVGGRWFDVAELSLVAEAPEPEPEGGPEPEPEGGPEPEPVPEGGPGPEPMAEPEPVPAGDAVIPGAGGDAGLGPEVDGGEAAAGAGASGCRAAPGVGGAWAWVALLVLAAGRRRRGWRRRG
ncbi:MAG: M23 family metallopeptidase [Myxococcales bacterium]|nr:M23 family metallopeptidase [Myxococcales bacterium]